MVNKFKQREQDAVQQPEPIVRRSFRPENLTSTQTPNATASFDLNGDLLASLHARMQSPPELETLSAVDVPTLVDDSGNANTFQFGESNTKIIRRRGFHRMGVAASGLVLGVVLTVLFVVVKDTYFSPALTNATTTTAKATTITPVEPVVEAQPVTETDVFTVPTNDIQNEIVVQEALVVPESGIVEYAKSQPVTVSPREFIYHSNTQRTFGASVIRPELPTGASKTKVVTTARSLEPLGKEGRYKSNKDSTEWQGGFKLDNPTNNVELGESYSGYVSNYGTNSIDKLSVIQKPGNSLLKKAGNKTPALKLSK